MTVLEQFNGCDGGKSGTHSGYAFGVPYGNKDGSNGAGISTTASLNLGLLNNSNKAII